MPPARTLRRKPKAPQVLSTVLVVDMGSSGGRFDPASHLRPAPALSVRSRSIFQKSVKLLLVDGREHRLGTRVVSALVSDCRRAALIVTVHDRRHSALRVADCGADLGDRVAGGLQPKHVPLGPFGWPFGLAVAPVKLLCGEVLLSSKKGHRSIPQGMWAKMTPET